MMLPHSLPLTRVLYRYVITTLIFLCISLLASSESRSELNKYKSKGHLKAIFSYGKRHEVEVFEGFPSAEKFFSQYVSPAKPVLFKGAAKLSPAYKLWNDDYFLSYPESQEFLVTVETKKKENRSQPANEVPFSTYLKYYQRKDIYMVNGVPDFIRKDVQVPSCLACENITNGKMLHNMMWLSSGGTKSVLHNDHAENINCIFKGTKQFYLVDKKFMDLLNVTELGFSDVDVDRVDLDKYPGLFNMEHYRVTVNPGDCLYIPFLWVHQVTSFDYNIAVNIWWKDKVEVEFDHCDPNANMTLRDVKFVGFDKFHDAHYKMIKGRLNHRIRNKGPMTLEDLVDLVLEEGDMSEPGAFVNEKIKEQMKKVLIILDTDPTDGIITMKELDILSQENLETIRQLFNSVIELHQHHEKQQGDPELPPSEEELLIDEQVEPDWPKEVEGWTMSNGGKQWNNEDGDFWPKDMRMDPKDYNKLNTIVEAPKKKKDEL